MPDSTISKTAKRKDLTAARSQADRSSSTQRAHATPMVSVYHGPTCIGHILGRCRSGFEAFNAHQHSLGMFPTAHTAADAISEAAS